MKSLSNLRALIARCPGFSGFSIGFFGVYFALSILTSIIENLLIAFVLTLFPSIALTVTVWSEKIPIIVIIISLFIPLFVVAAIVIQGIAIYELAETMLERSAVIAAIAGFLVASLKVAVESWRAWKDNINKEQDIKLRKEIFEFQKRNQGNN